MQRVNRLLPEITVNITGVPRHTDVEGNETADMQGSR